MFHKFSPYFLHIFFQFSPNFPNDKTELFPSSPVDGCLQEHWDWQDFLLQGMLPVQKFINRLHDFCVNRSCTCCGNLLETSHMTSRVCVCMCQDEFLSNISSCALSQSINWQKCHNKTGSFEWHPSIHAKTTGETVRRSHLLVLRQGLKQFHSKRAANWNRKKWKAWSKKVALQDPASTAAKSHSNLTFSVWTWVQYTWSKKALTWLYIEDITSKHRVLAPCTVLQREGFWQHKGLEQHNTISVASAILTCNGLATQKLRKGSPPLGGRYQFLKLQRPVHLLS